MQENLTRSMLLLSYLREVELNIQLHSCTLDAELCLNYLVSSMPLFSFPLKPLCIPIVLSDTIAVFLGLSIPFLKQKEQWTGH